MMIEKLFCTLSCLLGCFWIVFQPMAQIGSVVLWPIKGMVGACVDHQFKQVLVVDYSFKQDTSVGRGPIIFFSGKD